jgi:hypothetical protein
MRIKARFIVPLSGVVFTLTTLVSLAMDQPVRAAGTAPQPVVVELFTSQGCSSCPPADAFIEQLAARPDILAITRPVTYWDRLGWKDSLAREENTALQRSYAARGGEGAGVYTPQTMVQGQFGAVGSDRALVLRQIARARREMAAAIAIRPGFVAVDGKGAPADVKLITLKPSRIVRIGSGENGGRLIRYSNIVSSEQLLGRWTGGAETFALPKARCTERCAIIVQKPGFGAILAGGYLVSYGP